MTNLIGKKVTVKKGAGTFYEMCYCRNAQYLIITDQDEDGNYIWDSYNKDCTIVTNCSGHKLTESDFLPYKRDMTTLEQGDVIVNEDCEKRKVVGICGEAFILTERDNFDAIDSQPYLLKNIIDGYTLEGQEAPVEEIVIDGKRFNKQEVIDRVKELKSL